MAMSYIPNKKISTIQKIDPLLLQIAKSPIEELVETASNQHHHFKAFLAPPTLPIAQKHPQFINIPKNINANNHNNQQPQQ